VILDKFKSITYERPVQTLIAIDLRNLYGAGARMVAAPACASG